MRTSLAATLSPDTAKFQEKREAILSAAAQLFNPSGIKGVTLGEIAASVGLVTTSIAYCYRKKEDLATACLIRAINANQALAQEAAKQPSVRWRVSRYIELLALDRAAINSCNKSEPMLFNDIRALPQAQSVVVFEAYTQLFRQIRVLLQGPETASLSRQALNARTHLLLSWSHAFCTCLSRYELSTYSRVAQRFSDIVLKGLAAPLSTWPAHAAMANLKLSAPPLATYMAMDAFLRAATKLVNEQGYHGASVDKISACLRVTKGSFYHHNGNKLDLITACFERSFEVLRHALTAAEKASGPGWVRLCAVTAMLLPIQLSERGPLLRTTATSALPDQHQREQVGQTLGRLHERIASLLVDAMMDGSVRPQDMSLAALVMASSINAAAELRRWVPGINEHTVASLYGRPALLGLLCPKL